jgi:hypothetical protein
MEDMRIDRLEVQFDELAAEMRNGFRTVDMRLCKIESRLDQTATQAALSAVEDRLDQTATKAALSEVESSLKAALSAAEAGLKAALSAVEARLEQTATKADMQDSRIEMYKNNADMKTWLLATMIAIIALFCVALFGLHHWNG